MSNCEKCTYGASGGQTLVCCYYGNEETDPYGDCPCYEPLESDESGLTPVAPDRASSERNDDSGQYKRRASGCDI